MKYFNINNGSVSIVQKGIFKKLQAEELQLLLLTLYNYSLKQTEEQEGEKVSGVEMVNYLAGSSLKKTYDLLKAYASLLQKLPETFEYITETSVEAFEVKKADDNFLQDLGYIIKDEKGKTKNLLYELLEQAAKDMSFQFGGKFNLQTAKNMKIVRKFLSDNNLPYTEMNKMYKVFADRIFNYKDKARAKDISPFINFLVDIYEKDMREIYSLKMKGIQRYLEAKNMKLVKYTLCNEFNNQGEYVLSILEALGEKGDELPKFKKLLEEFALDYKKSNLSWTLHTVYNKLLSEKKYAKYLSKEFAKSNEQEGAEEYSQEFTDFINSIEEKDTNVIKKFFRVYKEKGLTELRTLLQDT